MKKMGQTFAYGQGPLPPLSQPDRKISVVISTTSLSNIAILYEAYIRQNSLQSVVKINLPSSCTNLCTFHL